MAGRGAVGTVYAAYDPQLGRRVALKLLHHSRSSELRLFREGRAMAQLSDPNVVSVHDVEWAQGSRARARSLGQGAAQALRKATGRRPRFAGEDRSLARHPSLAVTESAKRDRQAALSPSRRQTDRARGWHCGFPHHPGRLASRDGLRVARESRSGRARTLLRYGESPGGGVVKTKVNLLGHAVHPMLVAFPVAFYTATLVAFVVAAATRSASWFEFAVVANCAGVIAAILAAIPGFIDWRVAIPKGTQAKKTGRKHALLNGGALVLFAMNAGIQLERWGALRPRYGTAIVLTGIGLALTTAAGFLGWTLVQRHHVGVDLTPEQERLEPRPR
jgi:uncharacterized membrane protein